jgi:hypothetical protein
MRNFVSIGIKIIELRLRVSAAGASSLSLPSQHGVEDPGSSAIRSKTKVYVGYQSLLESFYMQR